MLVLLLSLITHPTTFETITPSCPSEPLVSLASRSAAGLKLLLLAPQLYPPPRRVALAPGVLPPSAFWRIDSLTARPFANLPRGAAQEEERRAVGRLFCA